MKIGIVGASGAGLPLSLLIKSKHPKWDVVVFDKNDKVGKKVLATGNGRCNILNLSGSPKAYCNPEFVGKVQKTHGIRTYLELLHSFGIETINQGDLVYPLSESAATLVVILKTQAIKAGVEFRLGEKVVGYDVGKDVLLSTEASKQRFDKVVFCTGGKSQEKLGSDGCLFPIFAGHGYSINPLNPVLTPVKTKEKTKQVSGLRRKCNLSVLEGGKQIFGETGEVLFKDDGLSGIVVFNASRFLLGHEGASISLDLFPDIDEASLQKKIEEAKSSLGADYLKSFFDERLAVYLQDRISQQNPSKILKNLPFEYISNYGFESSQVTRGGVSVDDLTYDLESKIEPNIFFAGEVIDVDGPCGGYNLGWCLISALAVSEAIR